MLNAENKNDVEFKIGLNEQRIGNLENDMRQCLADIISIESLAKMRDIETTRVN